MTVVCGICGREFDDERALDAHEHDAVAGDDALACPVCGQSFAREEDVVRHTSDEHVAVDMPDEERAVP